MRDVFSLVATPESTEGEDVKPPSSLADICSHSNM